MRPKDPDPITRKKLLDAAEQLMLQKGFVATSVDEICSGAGVTKGSFFHYFETKEALGKAALERFAQCQEGRFSAKCAPVKDPLERVYALIDCAITACRDPSTKGCLAGTFAQEISQTHPGLRKCCEQIFERFSDGVTRDLVAAKKLYAPQADFDAKGLGGFVLALLQGSLLVVKTTGDRKQMEKNILHLRNYLEALYGK